MICTERRGYTFITGQFGASERLFRSHECPVFQAVLEASIPDRVDRCQFESAGEQQDRFQSTAVVVIDTVEFTPEEAAQEIILHLKHESFIGLSEKAA